METVNALFAQAQQEAPRNLAGRPEVAAYLERPRPVLVMSRLHLVKAQWHPEKGSKEWGLVRTRFNTKPNKYHWIGSDCTRTRSSKWHSDVLDRILDGLEFDRLPEGERCRICDKMFQQA